MDASEAAEMREIWMQFKPENRTKLDGLRRAALALRDGAYPLEDARKAHAITAHTLGGAASMFGYPQARPVALELEALFRTPPLLDIPGAAQAVGTQALELVLKLEELLEL